MSSVKCFMSGVESGQHFQACMDAGVTHVLTSYYQFYRNPGARFMVQARKKKYPHVKFMVDSGAHSFIVDWTKFQGWNRQMFEDYVKGYTTWLRQNRRFIWAAVELDIDYCLNMVLGGNQNATVGTAIVEEWQRKYFKPLEAEGIQIIYVWHTERKLEGWEEMCSKHAYVGLPGEMSSQPDFNKYMSVARRYLTKVHGFAASVTGDSMLELKQGSRVFKVSIKEFFDSSRFNYRNAGVTQKIPMRNTLVRTLTNGLYPVWAPVSAVVEHASSRPIYEIELTDGRRIKGTGDHSFFTLTDNGVLRETKPTDMRSGDELVAESGTARFELVRIKSVKKVSEGLVDVYDLCVPEHERFFANGILAHNTKQADFRDWPWASIDSITWKTSEMYGALIIWDKYKQVLSFDQDKGARAKYRQFFEAAGCKADEIIADTNYKEVTKFALASMRMMEQFYEEKYANRLSYYDVRLPLAERLLDPAKIGDLEIKRLWAIMRPKELFKQHSGETSVPKFRLFLAALSAIQYKDDVWLKATPAALSFLGSYWPKLATPLTSDLAVFQREVAAYLAPAMPAALPRVTLEHLTDNDRAPKKREHPDYGLTELEHDFKILELFPEV